MSRSFLYCLFFSALAISGTLIFCLYMPGKSGTFPLTPLSPEEMLIARSLKRHVSYLASTIGERNYQQRSNLERAEVYIENNLRDYGLQVKLHSFSWKQHAFHNIEGSVLPESIASPSVIVGAHYDTTTDGPGANDNGSGVAALLSLAQWFGGLPLSERSRFGLQLRFVAFPNEEPPFFESEWMGSAVYAKHLASHSAKVRAMISLETMGFYSNQPHSQLYPAPLSSFYPHTGNFIAFVGNLRSASLVRESIEVFRTHTSFPSEGAVLPSFIPGVSWSDHASFWRYGIPALMVTDTAPNRYPYYHTAEDTVDKLDFDSLARVVQGLRQVILHLVKPLERSPRIMARTDVIVGERSSPRREDK